MPLPAPRAPRPVPHPRFSVLLLLQPRARLMDLPTPRHASPPRFATPRHAPPRPCPASTSASGELGARRFRERRVELVLAAFGMAAFSGPAGPILSLNPQEDAEFQKEVAQVRKRITQVSRHPGPGCERGRRTGSRGYLGLRGSPPGLPLPSRTPSLLPEYP